MTTTTATKPTGFLSQVTRGKLKLPHLILVYGPDGVGKSTFGSDAPAPIFLGTEKGTGNLDVARLPSPKTFGAVLSSIQALIQESHDYKTLVIDSLDWMEPLVWTQVCSANMVDSIENVGGGYGKGYVAANQEWGKMIALLNALRDGRGMHIVLIAHSQIRTFQDPTTNAGYDRYQLKLNEKAAGLFREFVDTVLFANYETLTKKDGSKVRAVGDGARFMWTERRPAFDAKNRWSLPFQLPLSWEDYLRAYEAGRPEESASIRARIEAIGATAPEGIKTKLQGYLKDAGEDPLKLAKLENKLKAATA